MSARTLREKWMAMLFLLAILGANAIALWPELSISRIDLNDNVLHFTLIDNLAQTVESGVNPMDFWSPEWSLGYPVFRTYQPLAHGLVLLVYLALGKQVGLMTVFVWIRFLSIVLLPLTFFATARLLQFAPLEALAASLLAPLISTNFLYGLEYGSYTWAGSGLFTQAVACHFFLLSIACAFQALRYAKRIWLAGVLLGLTFLAHFIYGYMAAITLGLLTCLPDARVPGWDRLRRAAGLAGIAALLCGFQIFSMIPDAGYVNHSRWEAVWKWDSFGPATVLKWLFTGQLLDHARLPVLTLLAFAGVVLMVARGRRAGHQPAGIFVVLGAALWILMYMGRPLWGPLLVLLGALPDVQVHRFIGGLHVFAVLLAGLALAWVWRGVSRRSHPAVAAFITIALLYPAAAERARFLANNANWGRKNLAAYQTALPGLDTLLATLRERGGRAYSGLAASWGGQFKVGDVPLYAFFSTAHLPAVAFLYHSMALTADVMVRFNEWNPAHYRLFNVRTLVAPVQSPPSLPVFLVPKGEIGGFRVYDTPANGYFDVVDVVASVKATRSDFYDVNDRWLQSSWPARRAHLWLDWPGDAPVNLQRLAPEQALPEIAPAPSPGEVRSQSQTGQVYQAELDVARPSFALFKMTWHKNWSASVDGNPAATRMLSPGLIGVGVPAGRHSVSMRYQPGRAGPLLALGGALLTLLLASGRLRAALHQAGSRFARWVSVRAPRGRRLQTAGGLILLALPVCIPLFTNQVLWGHDAFSYFPRVIELHQNVSHGILLPQWAPDLGRGGGQPLFVFHPPLFYWLAELWRLAGFDFVTAVNLACVVIVLASSAGMFLLGRLYFGETGAWLAATAYLYVPYFAVDLYVRSSLEEFAAFPLFAVALYGFGAYSRSGGRRVLMLGTAAYAGVLLSGFPAALLFTPLLAAFILWNAWRSKSWRLLRHQTAGFLLGLALAACAWLPALFLRQEVHLDRALQGYARYTNHFVFLHQLFYSPWGYGLSVPGPDDGMSFALGWSHIALAAGAWIWIVRRSTPADRQVLRFFGVAGILLSFLMLQDAVWLWDHIRPLQFVELPWRLLGLVAVSTAMLVGALGRVADAAGRWRIPLVTLAMALLIVPNLAHLRPGQMRDVDFNFWTAQQLALSGFETTTMGEVTPRWVQQLPDYDPTTARVMAGSADILPLERTPFFWSGEVRAQTAILLRMSFAYFPGWDVRVDGHSVAFGPASPGGQITFALPQGTHHVEVALRLTAFQRLARWISLAALIALLATAAPRRRSKTDVLPAAG